MWSYIGDKSLKYGGMFVKPEWDHAEIVSIIDLDSATGDSGLMLIERGTVSMPCKRDGMKKRVGDALKCCGIAPQFLRQRKLGPKNIRIMIAETLWYYGCNDVDKQAILAIKGDFKNTSSWEVDENLGEQDLWEYLVENWLDGEGID